MRDALESCRTADIGNVDDDDADDLAKSQGRDGEIVAAQTQRRQTDQRAEQSCRSAAREECRRKGQVEIRCEHDADIGTDRHKARVPKGKLSRVAVDEVEARRKDDVDARKDEIELPEGVQHPRTRQPHDDGVNDEGKDEHFEIIFR